MIRAIAEPNRQHAADEIGAIRRGVARVRRSFRVAISQCSAGRHVARLCHSSRIVPFTNDRIFTQHLGVQPLHSVPSVAFAASHDQSLQPTASQSFASHARQLRVQQSSQTKLATQQGVAADRAKARSG